MPMASPLEVVIVHSSDLHLGVDDSFSDHDRLAALPKVLTAANKVGADVVVLAGDTFDNHRQPLELLEHAAQMLRDYRNPIVILPGNHDPLTPDSVYRRGGLATIPNISILGLNVEESVTFPAFELEIWGPPHIDYTDMSPLANPKPRSARWHLAAAHGHFFGLFPSRTRITSSAAPHSPRFAASKVSAPMCGVKMTLSS